MVFLLDPRPGMWDRARPMTTQKDIARRLGVSPSLVSHVLGGRGEQIGAAARTVARIQRAARRLGYQPNAAALVLRGRSARTLGVVVKNFDDPYLGQMAGELHRLAQAAGYALMLTGCGAPPAYRPEPAPLLRFRLDGLLLAGSDVADDWFAPFARQGVRGVQIGSGPPVAGMRRVCTDEAWGMAAAVAHLVGLGHRRIAFIGDGSGAHERRRQALVAALEQRGLRPLGGRARAGTRGAAAVEQAVAAALAARATALAAGDDETAQRTVRALRDRGRQVPRDLSVTGMDDIPSARLTIPALTTVRQPLGDMVRTAFRLLTAPEGDERAAEATLVLRPQLVVRESTARPRAAAGRERNGKGT